jgi:hypothetical protein
VVVSALAKGAGPFPIRLFARPADEAGRPPLADDGPNCRPEPARLKPDPIPEPSVAPPPRERTFHLMVRDGDVASPGNYLAIRGTLRALGRRVQVYVDPGDAGRVGPELLRDVVATFDDRVHPTLARLLGPARDVDGDGRFTILLTGWLARLGGGRLAADGFVRGADLDPDLPAPFGNRCDMMYLSAVLRPGPHLRTVLAHEYAHAVAFSRKSAAGPEEEGWLDEALAHLVEDLHGFSRSNIDYRVSAFLSAPERYRLVVGDYYAADLFRSHGNRGSTYLFLRWCADRFGPDLLAALVSSRLRGVANLEAATGHPFARLYREWTTSLATGAWPSGASPAHRDSADGWLLAGPRTHAIAPGGGEAWSAAGTSSHFALVEGSSRGAVEVEVIGPPEADLQVTAIPQPAELPRVELSAMLRPGDDGSPCLQATIRGLGGDLIELTSLAWEPLVPPSQPTDGQSAPHGLDRLGLAESFGTSSLPPAGLLRSRPIPCPALASGEGPLVLKLVGIDPRGRRVVAWAEAEPLDDRLGALTPLAP